MVNVTRDSAASCRQSSRLQETPLRRNPRQPENAHRVFCAEGSGPDPYGNLIDSTYDASVEDNPFRFSTKFWDGETGLYYYGYRHYSPPLGRFVSQDPLGVDLRTIQEMNDLNAFMAMFSGHDAQGVFSAHVARNTRQLLEELYLLGGNDPASSIDYLGLAHVCCRDIPGSPLGSHCYINTHVGGAYGQCSLNRRDHPTCPTCGGGDGKKVTCVDIEDNPMVHKRTCYDVGNIDGCLNGECEREKKSKDCCKDTGPDGQQYDFLDNNSNHFVNKLLKACGSKCELGRRGRGMVCDGRRKDPDPKY